MSATNAELIAAIEHMSGQSSDLLGEVTNLRGQVEEWSAYGRHNRKLIFGLVASLLLDILLTVGLGFGLNATHNAAVEAKAATAVSRVAANNLKVICEAGNKSNAGTRASWDKVFTFPPPAHETPEAKATRIKNSAEFKAFLDKTYTKQKC